MLRILLNCLLCLFTVGGITDKIYSFGNLLEILMNEGAYLLSWSSVNQSHTHNRKLYKINKLQHTSNRKVKWSKTSSHE